MSAAQRLTGAVAAQRAGRLDEAARLYEAVLADEPGNADALHLLGVVMAETGERERAVGLMLAALTARPDLAACHYNFANLLQEIGRYPEALAHYDLALALTPEAAEAWYNRGNCLSRMGLKAEALASIEAALRVRPAYPAAELNRGVALQALGRHGEAEAAYRAALALRPGYVQALCNLGNVLRIVGRWDAARAACEDAIARQPGHADAHANLGNVLQNIGDHAGAMACYARALELQPGHVNAQWNRGLTLLRAGDYAAGWAAYEWRKKLATPVAARHYARPEWTGAEPVAGKCVFLHWEQGLGDTLQFCRYARLLAARGAEVVVAAPDPLVRLLRSLGPGVSVVGTHAVPTRFDLHCAMMSLPAAFGTTVATVPGAPYLAAAPAAAEAWRRRLAALPGRKVGLVWAGAARPEDPDSDAIDRRRSMRLSALAPLAAVAGVAFVSVQKGAPGGEAPPPGMVLHDWTAELGDFADTAALVAALDLVISVDTSTAHLAGALGRPVWVLNRFDHCWRWLGGTGASPWYPTARLFRQPAPGAWDAVAAEVAAALSRRG